MKLQTLALVSVLSLVSGFAQAEITYNYVEASHQIYSETDSYRWEVKGSYQLTDNLYLGMEDGNITSSRSASIGGFLPQSNGMHIYGQFGLGNNDLSGGNMYQSGENMYPILEAGVRAELNGDFEVRGGLRLEPELVVGPDDTGEMMLIGEALFHINDSLDLVGGLVLPSEADGNIIRLGARIKLD